jgi:hypothetical protein
MEIRPSEAEADLDVVVGEALVAATLALTPYSHKGRETAEEGDQMTAQEFNQLIAAGRVKSRGGKLILAEPKGAGRSLHALRVRWRGPRTLMLIAAREL